MVTWPWQCALYQLAHFPLVLDLRRGIVYSSPSTKITFEDQKVSLGIYSIIRLPEIGFLMEGIPRVKTEKKIS